MYNTYTLRNGLRVIHRHCDSPIIYCGFQIAAGTRDEAVGEEGLAHFCEHVTFKGTERRTALQIINALEGIGGELNAFTNKESTVFYCAIQREHYARAIDVLSDIVFHSTYPQHEIDKEVEVICDEIESYNDSPSELIYDEFENTIFKNHPLGHNILGTVENVRSFKTEDAKRFTSKYYTPDNAIFFCYGDVDFKRMVKMIAKSTPALQSTKKEGNALIRKSPEDVAWETPPQEVILKRGTHQAHVMMGGRAYDVHSDKRIALYLLNNILGGPGMNARLNLSLRERRGLVYTVESTMVSYGDTGLWSIYFGCDHEDVKRCVNLVKKELQKFADKPMAQSKLTAAKRQIKGQIALSCDNHENFAIDFGKSFLHYGWEKDVTSLYNKIDAVTADDIQTVAQELFKAITILIYGA